MRYLLLLLIILFSTQAFAQANDADAAKRVTSNFLNAIKNSNYKQAKQYGTKETKDMLEMMAAYSTMMPDSLKAEIKKTTFVIEDVLIEGKKATVKFTTSEAEGKVEELELIMINDQWLIDIKMPEGVTTPEMADDEDNDLVPPTK